MSKYTGSVKWKVRTEMINHGRFTSTVKKVDSSLIEQPLPLTPEELKRYKANKWRRKRKSKILFQY